MAAQLKGPRILRDISLLIRLLWRLEGWEDPTSRSAMAASISVLQNIGGMKGCDCSTCNSVVDSSKTTASILEPHIRALINTAGPGGLMEEAHLAPDAIESAVYSMLGKYLTCLDEDED